MAFYKNKQCFFLFRLNYIKCHPKFWIQLKMLKKDILFLNFIIVQFSRKFEIVGQSVKILRVIHFIYRVIQKILKLYSYLKTILIFWHFFRRLYPECKIQGSSKKKLSYQHFYYHLALCFFFFLFTQLRTKVYLKKIKSFFHEMSKINILLIINIEIIIIKNIWRLNKKCLIFFPCWVGFSLEVCEP